MRGRLAVSLLLCRAMFVLLSLDTAAKCQGITPAGAYAYNGGSFPVTVTFRAFVSYEFDGLTGGDLGNPGWIVATNLTTGKTASFPYLQALQLPQAVTTSGTSGNDIISGTVTINPDELGPGPLSIKALEVSVGYPARGTSRIKNVYGNYLSVTLFPLDVRVGLPPYQASGPGSSASVPPVVSTPTNIHAVIISGLSDPAKVISSSNVTLTGGIVALGKNASQPTSSAWSPGLRIVPDYALLTGEKIPPVTPNIIDVRIVRQEATADFPAPSPQSSN